MKKQAIIGSLALSLLATASYAQSECDSYVVREGDTIRNIAFNAYGEEELFESLYEANKQVLAANAPAFAAGTELDIPCYDDLDFAVLGAGIGRLSVASSDVQVASIGATPVEPAVVDAATALQEIRFVTGSDFKPFSDVDLENGGMFTELVATAVDRSGIDKSYAVDFEDNWSSHLDQLLPSGEYDVSFPWYRPNCELGDKLSAEMQDRCSNFAWSEPYYETVVGMYTNANGPLTDARTSFDLFGTRVCRPERYFTFDLEEADLVAPNVTFSQPDTAAECFTALLEGRVDVVTMNVLVAESTIADMRATGDIVEMEEMATIQTLHAIALRSNPEALRYLDSINSGIREMSGSGEWIAIVRRHLANAS